jgi:hypothetical protein
MTQARQPITVEATALNTATVEEYCTSLVAARTTPFWTYFLPQKLVGNYSLPYKATDGTWWYQVKPGLSWPADVLSIRDTVPQLPLSKTYLGYQCIANQSIANASQCINVINHLQTYDFENINAKRRNAIRKGIRNCTLKVIDTYSSHVVDKMLSVWNDFVIRTGWKRKISRPLMDTMLRRTLDLPGTTVLAGIDNTSGCIAGFLITKVIGDTAYVDTIASHSKYMGSNVNDLLMYSFIYSAKSRVNVTKVHYAIKSYDSKLEYFKESMGFTPTEYPSLTRLQPGVGGLLRMVSPGSYRRLMGIM